MLFVIISYITTFIIKLKRFYDNNNSTGDFTNIFQIYNYDDYFVPCLLLCRVRNYLITICISFSMLVLCFRHVNHVLKIVNTISNHLLFLLLTYFWILLAKIFPDDNLLRYMLKILVISKSNFRVDFYFNIEFKFTLIFENDNLYM